MLAIQFHETGWEAMMQRISFFDVQWLTHIGK